MPWQKKALSSENNMRKRVFGKKLSRSRKARNALLRSLLKALIVNGKITTTKAKVKFIQGQADKLITSAKKGSLSARRKALSFLGNDRKTTDFLFLKLAPLFKDRTSGFTRITLLPRRKGDNAEMAVIEWMEKYSEVVKKSETVSKTKIKKENTDKKNKKIVKKTETKKQNKGNKTKK